jgi:FSR family fosmidomycin resistance protein-like MFS transporter
LKPAQSSAAFSEIPVHATTYAVLFAVSFCHLLNDMMQSLMSAIYPQLKDSLELNFAQVGLISATYQLTASLLQPVVGYYSDKRPMPFSLPVAMAFTLVGLVVLSQSHTYLLLILAGARSGGSR